MTRDPQDPRDFAIVEGLCGGGERAEGCHEGVQGQNERPEEKGTGHSCPRHRNSPRCT